MIKNGIIETSVVVKESKIPNHSLSGVLKNYKQNTILRGLHRAYNISSNFELEKQRIKKKYLRVSFQLHCNYNFIQYTFNAYQQKCKPLIPHWLFEERHIKTIHIKYLFAKGNFY